MNFTYTYIIHLYHLYICLITLCPFCHRIRAFQDLLFAAEAWVLDPNRLEEAALGQRITDESCHERRMERWMDQCRQLENVYIFVIKCPH